MRLVFTAGLIGVVALLLLTACDSPAKKEASYIEHGKSLYESGEYVKAALQFKNAAQINPVGAEAPYYLGLIAEKQHDVAGAAASFRKAASNDPKNADAQVKAGRYALMTGDPTTAKSFADQAIATGEKVAEGRNLKAAILLLQGQTEQAEKEAQAALALDPKSVDAYILLAGVKVRNKDTAAAADLVERGLTVDPKSVDLLIVKLKLMADAQNTAEMESVLRQLVAIDPTNPAYVVDLSNQLAAKGALPEAEAVYKQALDKKADSDELLSAYATFLATKRSLADAITQIKLMADAPDAAPKYRFLLEQLYIKANQLDLAEGLMIDLQKNAKVANDRLLAEVEIARIAILRNDRAGAMDKVNAVIAKDPENEAAFLLRSALRLEDAQYDNAIADARTVLHSNINSIGALAVLAKAYVATGDSDLAITTLRNLLRVAPNNLDARLQLASLLAASAPDEAIEQLDTVIAARPDAVELRVQKADFLARTGQSDKAETIGQELIAQPASAAIGYRILGQAALARSDYATATDQLLKAEAGGQPFSAIGPMLISAYARSGKQEEGATLLQQRLAKEPGDIESKQLLANLRATQGKFEEAEKLLHEIIAAKPDKPDTYLNLAQLYTQQKRADDSLNILKEAAQRFPDNRNISLFTAIAYDTANQYEAAETLYEKVLTASPGNLVAANNLATLIADAWPEDRTKLDRARQLGEKFRHSGDPFALDTLGWVLVRQKNYDDAAILLERSVSLAPDNQQILYHYGVALQEKGLNAKAKEALAKSVAGNPVYRGVEDARVRASTLN